MSVFFYTTSDMTLPESPQQEATTRQEIGWGAGGAAIAGLLWGLSAIVVPQVAALALGTKIVVEVGSLLVGGIGGAVIRADGSRRTRQQ